MVLSRDAKNVRRAAKEMPAIQDGKHEVELNLQTLELKVRLLLRPGVLCYA
jgi:hypothetical protein